MYKGYRRRPTRERMGIWITLGAYKHSPMGVFSKDGCTKSSGPNINGPGTKLHSDRSMGKLGATRTLSSYEATQVLVGFHLAEFQIR